MIDIQRTLKLASGALFDREATWKDYLPDAENWQKTLLQLTIPLIVVSSIAAFLLSSLTADDSLMSLFKPTVKSTLIGMFGGVVVAGIVAAIFGGLAGVFGGKTSIALGLAATTLAFVPGYLGQAVAWLPWIGRLAAFCLGIFSLVLLWRIIPLYLEVPKGKRAAHYIVSLLATLVVMFFVSRAILPSDYAELGDSPFAGIGESKINGEGQSNGAKPGVAGMMSEAAQISQVMRAAIEDRYTPPADGKVTEQQARDYVSNIEAAGEEYREKMAAINAVSADLEKDGDVSFADVSKIMKAANANGGIAVVEMSAVKSSGGNWAEHQWVRQTLVTAGRSQDTSPASVHNFALYQKYEEAIVRGMN